jgi:hypothetical protein
MGEWINKSWYLLAMKSYSVLKLWVIKAQKIHGNKEYRLLCERSQIVNTTYYMISTVALWKSQNYGGGWKKSMVCWCSDLMEGDEDDYMAHREILGQ